MHSLERAAILEKQRKELMEELIDERVCAETAEILLETHRLTGEPVQQRLDLAAD